MNWFPFKNHQRAIPVGPEKVLRDLCCHRRLARRGLRSFSSKAPRGKTITACRCQVVSWVFSTMTDLSGVPAVTSVMQSGPGALMRNPGFWYITTTGGESRHYRYMSELGPLFLQRLRVLGWGEGGKHGACTQGVCSQEEESRTMQGHDTTKPSQQEI